MVSGWVKDSHRCGLPLQQAAPTQAFKMLPPPPLPHLFLTNQHTQSSLSSTSSAASFNHRVNSLEYTTCRCGLVTTKFDFRAGVSPSPDAHRYSTSCLLFQKTVFSFDLTMFPFFIFLLTHFRAAVTAYGYIVRCSVRDEIHLNESLKV